MTDTITVITEQIPGPQGAIGPAGATGAAGDPTILGDDSSFGASDPILSRLRRATTSNGTVFTAWSYDLPANGGVDLVVTIVGKDQASGAMYRCDHRVGYSRNASAAPAVQETLVTAETAPGSLASASSTIDVSSNTIRVRITPANGVTTKWSITAQAQQI